MTLPASAGIVSPRAGCLSQSGTTQGELLDTSRGVDRGGEPYVDGPGLQEAKYGPARLDRPRVTKKNSKEARQPIER